MAKKRFIVDHECQNRLYLELKYDGIAPRLRFVSTGNFIQKRSTQKVISLSIEAFLSILMNTFFIKRVS